MVSWGPQEEQINSQSEQASQEQVSEVKPVTPTEPVTPPWPTNRISQETFTAPITTNRVDVATVSEKGSKPVSVSGSVHTTDYWNSTQNGAIQPESN